MVAKAEVNGLGVFNDPEAPELGASGTNTLVVRLEAGASDWVVGCDGGGFDTTKETPVGVKVLGCKDAGCDGGGFDTTKETPVGVKVLGCKDAIVVVTALRPDGDGPNVGSGDAELICVGPIGLGGTDVDGSTVSETGALGKTGDWVSVGPSSTVVCR